MNNLPDDIVGIILLNLEVQEIFSTFIMLCKNFYTLTMFPKTLSKILSILIGSNLNFFLSKAELLNLLKKIYTQDPLQRLNFFGFATDGGMIDNIKSYWVSNLYEYNYSAYCSKNSSNVNCAAFLASLCSKECIVKNFNPMVIERLFKELRLFYHPEHYYPPLPLNQLLPIEEGSFLRLWEERRSYIISQLGLPEEEIESFYESLQNSFRTIEKFQSPSNPSLYVQPIDHVTIKNSLTLACIREVQVIRTGSFSCPLKTFILFTSDEFIEITSEEFRIYDNLARSQDLKGLSAIGAIPKVQALVSGTKFEYHVFNRTSKKLKPILWGRFKDIEKKEASIRLDQAFSGRYLYAKLIDFDDARHISEDHLPPNIDCSYIGVLGLEFLIIS